MLAPARARGLQGRPGIAHRRAAAVGVVRPRLQHEGAGARAARSSARSRSSPAWSGPAATCCSSSTTRCRCATWQSGWAARADRRRRHRREPRLHALRSAVARAVLSARRAQLVAVRGVRVVTPASHVFAWEPLGKLFAWAERSGVRCAAVLRNLGGFLILVAGRDDDAMTASTFGFRPRACSAQRRTRSAALLLQPAGPAGCTATGCRWASTCCPPAGGACWRWASAAACWFRR